MEFFQAIANMSGESLAQHLANGISLGSLYALIAIGYTMVYGILLMINFAHGDIVMMACYFAFFGITVFHIPWYITFVGVIIATAILGVVIERTAYRTEKFCSYFCYRRFVFIGKPGQLPVQRPSDAFSKY